MNRTAILALLFLGFCLTANSQDFPWNTVSRQPVERLYVHHDRTSYYAGETVWMKIYQTVSEEAVNASGVAYVDLVNGQRKVVAQAKYPLQNGRGTGCMELPEDLPGGRYLLRAYTRWMQNEGEDGFFRQELTVYGPQTEKEESRQVSSDISFYPEGGYLVENLPSRIAFETRGSRSQQLFILDDNNDTVMAIRPMLHGKGIFTFQPQPHQRYRAVVKGKSSGTPLPKALKEGFTLHTQLKSGRFQVRLSHNLPPEKVLRHTYSLVLHRNRQLIVQTEVDVSHLPAMISYPVKELPAGVFTVSLIDESCHAYCERLAFVRFPEQLNLNLTASESKEKAERKIKITLHATYPDGTLAQGEFSLAAVNPLLEETRTRFNMASYLFLGSELKGNVTQPADYWNPSLPNATERIELLLLTQGWRRYSLKQNTPTVHPMETGLELRGAVDLPRKKKPEEVTIQAVLRQDSLYEYAQFKPDSNRHFVLGGTEFTGTKDAMLSAYDKNGKEYALNIDLPITPKTMYTPSAVPMRERLMTEWKVKRQTDQNRITERIWELGEVEITARRQDPIEKKRMYSSAFVKSAVEIETNKVQGTVINYLRRVPGITMRSNPSHYGPRLEPYVNGAPQKAGIVLDGIFQRDPEITYAMDISQIARIEVLSPTATMFGGFNSTGGIICLYTRPVRGETVNSKRTVCEWIGYSQTKEFYVPDETDKNFPLSSQPRNTYYWNPLIKTNAKGYAEVSFPMKGNEGKPLVHCEGISEEGYIGTACQE